MTGGSFAVQAENLGKRYRIVRGKRRVMLRQALSDAVTSGLDSIRLSLDPDAGKEKKSTRRTFWALHDVSFRIRSGESVGIIGPNGAGKSTLLKILARVTAPTVGKARLRGRVGSLLEVGTGFHSELTGRENIYLNGAILGMRRREIECKFDEIVDFSGVEEFLETPVKFFSSGMRMRLAFSVAAHLEPEILLVDEVLAVGDAAFQQKCLSKMGDVVGHGRTVLFVSHNMAAVRALCQSAMFIDRGGIVYSGDVNGAIQQYLSQDTRDQSQPLEFERSPSRRVQILSVSLEDESGAVSTSLPHDRPFSARIKFAVREPVYRGHLEFNILDDDLNAVATVRDVTENSESLISRSAGTHTYRLRFPTPSLIPGRYRLRVRALTRHKSYTHLLDEVNAVWPFEIYDSGSLLSRMNIPWSGKVILPVEWDTVEHEEVGSP